MSETSPRPIVAITGLEGRDNPYPGVAIARALDLGECDAVGAGPRGHAPALEGALRRRHGETPDERQEGVLRAQALDVERLDLKIRVLEHRADNLELKSPLGGMVIRGDLDKAEGAPLVVAGAGALREDVGNRRVRPRLADALAAVAGA